MTWFLSNENDVFVAQYRRLKVSVLFLLRERETGEYPLILKLARAESAVDMFMRP
jgi:hypothetical protein